LGDEDFLDKIIAIIKQKLLAIKNDNSGTELISAAIRKYRVLAAIYIILDTISLAVSLYLNKYAVRVIWILSGFLLTLAIAYAVYPKRKIFYLRIVLILGFLGQLAGSIHSVYIQIIAIKVSLKALDEFSLEYNAPRYMTLIQKGIICAFFIISIIDICLIALFLALLIINYLDINIVRAFFYLAVIYMVTALLYFAATNIYTAEINRLDGTSIWPPDGYPFSYLVQWIIGRVGSYSGTVGGWAFYLLQILLARCILKSNLNNQKEELI